MADHGGTLRRPALHWLSHWAIEHWPSIAVLLVGSAMTYLASLSKWMDEYGPVAWGAVGVLTVLILCVGYWIYGIASSHSSLARFVDDRRNTTSISPLERHFSNKRMNLFDFFHPFYKAIEHAQFENCELFGPALLMTEEANNFFSLPVPKLRSSNNESRCKNYWSNEVLDLPL